MAEVKMPTKSDDSGGLEKYKSLPSNSYKSKAEKELEEKQSSEPRLTKRTSGVKQKKGLSQRFKETFLSPDSDNVGSYILWDILIPSAKETFADLINGAINILLFDGENRSSNRRGGSRRITDYSGKSKITIGGRSTSSSRERTSRGRRFADDILIEGTDDQSARQVALDILDEMNEAIFEYGQVRLSDYYDAVGVDWSYTDKNWGWTSLEGVKPRAVRGGVIIDLPELEQL